MKRIHPSILLLGIAALAYGIFIPQLGFYWDDLPMSWIRYQLGVEAMMTYFSTNRPVWAWLYRLTTSVIPQVPIFWQIFAFFWRWAGAVTVWALVRSVFPQRDRSAFIIAGLFLLYPGFNQQPVSYLYSHFFIVLFFFLLSLLFSVQGKKIPALLLAALNLWMIEYFFTLELIRPFLFFARMEGSGSRREKLIRTSKEWLPYLGLFILAVLSRLFIFNNQIYGFGLKDKLVENPVGALVTLAGQVAGSLWVTTFSAWGTIFQFPSPQMDGPRVTLLYAAVLILAAAVVYWAFYRSSQTVEVQNRKSAFAFLGIGLVMLILAGPPFWLTGVPVSLGFPANRATLSFMLGSVFLLDGVLEFIPARVKTLLGVGLIALAAGRQFLWANEFRRDWDAQKAMFWQMTWRAPGYEKNTMVLINEQLLYYADNSLAAALNWIYAPDNRSTAVDYVLFYPTNRSEISAKLEPGIPVKYDFLAGEFNGNTSQAVVFYYSPPGCLRLLDAEIEASNRLIPEETLLRDAMRISSTAPIRLEQTASMPEVYQPEPAHGWCYYFQKADLARQFGDWDEVVRLAENAFATGDYPNDPIERFVFIEGYAHAENWEKAIELSTASYKISKSYVGPPLCNLWQRITRETKVSEAQKVTLKTVQKDYQCDW